jgi:hypothetical protein
VTDCELFHSPVRKLAETESISDKSLQCRHPHVSIAKISDGIPFGPSPDQPFIEAMRGGHVDLRLVCCRGRVRRGEPARSTRRSPIRGQLRLSPGFVIPQGDRRDRTRARAPVWESPDLRFVSSRSARPGSVSRRCASLPPAFSCFVSFGSAPLRFLAPRFASPRCTSSRCVSSPFV